MIDKDNDDDDDDDDAKEGEQSYVLGKEIHTSHSMDVMNGLCMKQS